MSVCEDCVYYKENSGYCAAIKRERPSILIGCDYFKSYYEQYLEYWKLRRKKDMKARYHFSTNGAYRKIIMRKNR